METGAVDSNATYSYSAKPLNYIDYRYEVQSGDRTDSLDYQNMYTHRIGLDDSFENTIACKLPLNSAGHGRIRQNYDIVVDGTPPEVESVSSPNASRTYGAGETIAVNVTFTKDVEVNTTSGRPLILMETGATDRNATYHSGSGTPSLLFTYAVQFGDASDDLDYAGESALSLGGGSITDAAASAANAANLTLPAPGTDGLLAGSSNKLVVDGVRPTVASVSSTDDAGTYGIGSVINVTVTFDGPVTVDTTGGTPTLLLETGETDRSARYVSGSGADLLFRYTVMENDTSTDLEYNSAPSALALNGGSIVDGADNPANAASLSLSGLTGMATLAGSEALVVDGVRPTVASVSSTDDAGTYGIGSVINVTVTFDGPVTVDTTGGTPTLLLETGETDRSARYVSGSGADLLFRYTVMENDTSTDLEYNSAPSALALNGGSIVDGADNPANAASLSLSGLTGMATLAGSEALVVDGVRPTVASVSSTDDAGTYGIGSVINVTVTFDGPVTVDTTGGTPTLLLETGETDRSARYVSGSGADLLFRYTVMENDTSTDLEYNSAPSALALNGGSIVDGADNPANAASLSLSGLTGMATLAGSEALVVDGVRPEVVSVSSPNATGEYEAGDAITIRVMFDDTVHVDTDRGVPRIALDTGRAGSHADYSSGSGSGTLLFGYIFAPVDESEDLAYAGRSALTLGGGTIRDGADNDARLALPARGSDASLSGSAAISVVHAAPPLIASASVDKDDYGGLPLGGVEGVDAFAVGNATYVIVTSPSNHTVQMLRVHENNGTLSPAGNATDGGSLLLEGAADVAALGIGNETFAIVAAAAEPAVQLLRVHENNGTLSPAGNATDGGDFRLGSPSGVDAFVTGDGRAYAVVASLAANEIQVVRIHGNNGTLSAGPGMSATVAGTGLGAWYVDTFAVGDRAYALVTATHDYDGVQLFRVHDDGRLEPSASATDDDNGFDALNGSRGVDTFVMGNATYAIVVSEHDGAQLIRVHYDGTLEAAGSAFNGTGGFDALGGARAVSVFNDTYGDPYAVVTSQAGDAVQLVHIHDDGTLLPAGSAADEMPGPGGKIFDALDEPHGVASFYLDGRAYAAVASRTDSAIQLIRLSPASATGAATAKAGGAYGPGTEIGITVAFSDRVNVTGRPELRLNSGGVAVYQPGSNNSLTLDFLYTVGIDDHAAALDYYDEFALYGPGVIVEASAGVDADRTLPAPGSPGSLSGADASAIEVDGVAPRVASVASATPDGEYGAGRTIEVAVRFTEPVSYSGAAPELILNVSGAPRAVAADASGNGTDRLVFAYTARTGDMSGDLAYWNATALSGGLADAVGNAANLTLRAPGSPGSLSSSSAIAIDGIAPRVASVASATPDGEYGAGRTIEVAVRFTEPVSYSGAAPELILNVSGAPRAVAADASGNGTDRLVFAYTARTGDMSGDLAYWNATALSGGLADAVGNAANLTLRAPGSPGSLSSSSAIAIDGIAPRVASVASATPDGEYGAGRTIEVAVRFTEPVSYSGAAPELILNVSGAPRAVAADASGNGTAMLSFAYTVQAGDMSDDLAYWNATALSGGIADAAGNTADLALPEPGSPGSLSGLASISVDGSAPAAATADAAFTGPNTVRIEYSAPLGPPAGHAGPVYGTITIGDDARATPETGGVSGLGTAVHTVRFSEKSAESNQNGTIVLNVALEGEAGGARYSFTADTIFIRSGDNARTLVPFGAMPVVAIEPDGFVRAVNATGAGDDARPAIDVSGLANASLSADASRNTVRFPVEGVNLTASFAEVMIPLNATAMSIPADGRLDLYVSAQGPTARQVADALGTSVGAIGSIRVVEVGDNATHIVFDLPVRILLVGHANGTAFYVNNTDRTVVPIRAECAADDTDAVHKRLNGTGIDECWLDSGADKVIHTYHLTLFGTAMAPGGGPPFVPVCSISLEPQPLSRPPPIKFGGVREGAQSAVMGQEIENTGTLPIDAVTIRATAWTDASGSEAMPASATSVMAGARGWVALDGEVAVPGSAGGATAKFRVEVPAGALPEGAPAAGVEASQTVTYTAACGPPP